MDDRAIQDGLILATGKLIARERSQRGWSRRELARRIGTDVMTIVGYEEGRMKYGHRFDILVRLAIVLELPLEELLRHYVQYVHMVVQTPHTRT